MSYAYDDQNIFAKILRGQIPCTRVLETEHSLAFRDIAPQAPEHVLVVPKGAYVCYTHFMKDGSDAEILDFHRAVAEVCRMFDLIPGEGGTGYRIITNSAGDGMQEVPHLHYHVLGGRRLGKLLPAE